MITAHDLFGALHSGRCARRLLMVLRAYFDVSKTEPFGVTCIAGHVGDEAAWATFEAEWQKALDYWDLRHFHLTDLTEILGRERAILCVRNFAQIISKTELRGFYAGLRDEDWEQSANYQEYRAQFPTRAHVVLDMVLGRLSMEINLNLPDEDTLVVLDSDYTKVDAARAIYEHYAAGNPRLVGLAITHAPQLKPLQAADMLAGMRRRDWATRGFESERRGDAYGPRTWDDRALMAAAGRWSFGSMWSLEIARQIEQTKAAVAAQEAARTLRASEEE